MSTSSYPPESLGEMYEDLARLHGKKDADRMIAALDKIPVHQVKSPVRTSQYAGVKAKRMAPIRKTGTGNPNWRQQKAKAFHCRHCGAEGDDITITGSETPNQPTMANCVCGESWELTSRKRY